MSKVISVELIREIEQFLYREARALDEERYEDWLEMLTADVHYWMPAVQARYRADRALRYDPKRMAHFDDNLDHLRQRVSRFLQPTAWSEDPPTRHCHIVSNIEVESGESAHEYRVHSVFTNVRSRNESDEDWIAGRRRDLLRRGSDETLRIARREVVLTQAVILSKNLNTFF